MTTTTTQAATRATNGGATEDRGAVVAAWIGFLFGTCISVGGNVLATWLPKLTGKVTDPEWSPGWWPQVGAAVWPLALVVSVEVLTRTNWRAGVLWTLARVVSVFTVALGGAVISYGHLHEVLTAWHYPALGAMVGPLVIDGLMLISGFALLSISRNRKDPIPATTAAVSAPSAVADGPGNPAEATAVDSQEAGTARRDAQPSRTDKSRTRKSRTARAVRSGSASAGQGSANEAKARELWEAETAQGRTPTGAALARAAGVDASMGRRWRRDWETDSAGADGAAATTETEPTGPTGRADVVGERSGEDSDDTREEAA